MKQHERPRPDNQSPAAPSPEGDAGGANLNAIRQAAAGLLAAADAAIDQALSGDSQAFNAAVQQEGGQ